MSAPQDALEAENAKLRAQVRRLVLKRARQPVVYSQRHGECSACHHVGKYNVSTKGTRLRDTPCANCGVVLARGSNRRARRELKRRMRRRNAAGVVDAVARTFVNRSKRPSSPGDAC